MSLPRELRFTQGGSPDIVPLNSYEDGENVTLRYSESPKADTKAANNLSVTINDVPYEEVFHSATTSPMAHQDHRSSNKAPKRAPSPLRIEQSHHDYWRHPYSGEVSRTLPATSRHPHPTHSSAASASTYYSVEPAQPSMGNISLSSRPEPGASIRRKPLRAAHPVGVTTAPAPPQTEEDRDDDALEATNDLDCEDLANGEQIALPAEIGRRLREAAQEYVSRPSSASRGPRRPEHPPSASSNSKRRSWFHTRDDKSRRPSAELKRRTTNESVDHNDGDEDPEFCCTDAKRAATINDASAWYCYACRMTFCKTHWMKEMSHRRKRPGHEKVDAAVAKMIEHTLEVDVSDTEQAELHLMDESASWFGAIHSQDGGVIFRDFGRYAAVVADKSLAEKRSCYPALISFVGDTGAGKSSLIKLLVGVMAKEAPKKDDKPPQTPVVGNNGAVAPTSGDVHLYTDPSTFHTDRPLLYADCEGLRGGTLEPVGAKRRRKLYGHTQNRARTASFDRHVRRRYETAEREVVWATTPQKSTRKYFVEHLYPRLLYTFSDVIVFVVKNARMIEDVIEQLIAWADAVIETASNQPVLPHAIIVLNASDNQDANLWQVDASTNALLEEINQAVDKNPRLKDLAEKWNGRGFHINSIHSLLLAYYTSVRVVRIPEKSQPSLIHDQIRLLYEEIRTSVTESHQVKCQKRLKLNAEQLQPYLQQAFDHYCQDLDNPFDFIKASFADSGIPTDFCGNTLKLAVDIMKHWSSRLDGVLIFRELSFIIASCVMLDAVRNRKLGSAGAIFKEYIDHFDETLDDFCEKVWPCEFVSVQGRCSNVRAGHTKGHQLGGGHVINGEYQSRFSPETHRQKYRCDIYEILQELLTQITQLRNSETEEEAAAALHQETILGPFYKHFGGAHHFVSHSACFSCLVNPAEHCLPCGHVLCTPCIKTFGNIRSHGVYEIRYCPLHKEETSRWTQVVAMKPEHAGTRVLTLDGGGVRGILMLMMLSQIERHLGGIPVESFFDLIVGTSTGGIIALGLVEMGWGVPESIEKFETLAKIVFRKHRMWPTEFTEFLLAGFQGGRYRVEPLEEILLQQFSTRNLFGGMRHDLGYSATNHITAKVAVTATSTNGTPFLLANYNRVEKKESSRYKFLRAEKPQNEIRVWEAARATSAAPKIFKPYTHAASGHTFADGGVYYNNPIDIALTEHASIWSQQKARLPDIVLSLGTGYSEKKKMTMSPDPGRRNVLGIVSYYKSLLKIAVDHVKSSQRSEDEYDRVRQHFDSMQHADIVFKRFNIRFPENFVSLKPDKVENMTYLQEYARYQFSERQEEIRSIADRLIATSFYFDIVAGSMKRDATGAVAVRGQIRCRFPPNSAQLRSFGDLLRSRIREAFNAPCSNRHTPCFVIEDRSCPGNAEQLVLSDTVLSGMEGYGQLNLGQIEIVTLNPNVECDIYLRFGSEPDWAQHNSISGFPKCWDDKHLTPMTSRLDMHEIRGRQPSRRGRDVWSEPTSAPVKVLKRYVRERNPGLATDEQLTAVEDRLSSPAPSQMPPSELQGDYSLPSWQPDRKAMQASYVSLSAGVASPPPPYGTAASSEPRTHSSSQLQQSHIYEMEGSFPSDMRTILPRDVPAMRDGQPQTYAHEQYSYSSRTHHQPYAWEPGLENSSETSDMYGS